MVSNENTTDLLTGLSEQQRRLLRAFGADGAASATALQQAFVEGYRRLTRSEQASLSRTLRRLEHRGLLTRTVRGTVTLTADGIDLVFPARRIQEAQRQARLDDIASRLARLEQQLKFLR